MYQGKCCSVNGPTTAQTSHVAKPSPLHAAATLAACAGAGIALTTAFLYPGSDHGGSNDGDEDDDGASSSDADAEATTTTRRRRDGVVFRI